MLTKISLVNDFVFNAPPVEIIKVSSEGTDKNWFKQRSSPLLDKVANLQPKEGYTPLLIIPMGSLECYGPNRNADGWPKSACEKVTRNGDIVKVSSGLIDRHNTFVTHAHAFEEHNNDDPSKSSGFIKLSNWNPDMDRIELVVYVDNNEWDNEIQKVANNENCTVSMAAGVDRDFCSICSNESYGEDDYCNHIKFFKNAILDDGHHIHMINENPTFKDLSKVSINADRLGYGLGKISLGGDNEKTASVHDTNEKIALLDKLSEIEKMISSPMCPADKLDKIPSELPAMDKVDDGTVMLIKCVGPEKVTSSLSDKGCVLPPHDFFKSIADDDEGGFNNIFDQIKSSLPSIFRDLKSDVKMMGDGILDSPLSGGEDSVMDDRSDRIANLLKPMTSVLPEDAKIRIEISQISTPSKKKEVIKKESREVSKEGKELAKAYGKYVIDSLCKMKMAGLKADLDLPIIRCRLY